MEETDLQNESKTLWHKVVPLKELVILLLGSVLTLLGTMWANHLNNSEQFAKEIRDRKLTYTDSYLKDLNQRYYLFETLINEVALEKQSKADIVKIKDCSQKLDDARSLLNVNSQYDQFQFHRYFSNKYYTEISQINAQINDYSQDAEANNKKVIIELRKIKAEIFKQLMNIETQIYKELDTDKF